MKKNIMHGLEIGGKANGIHIPMTYPRDVFMDTKQVDAVFATGKNNSQPK